MSGITRKVSGGRLNIGVMRLVVSAELTAYTASTIAARGRGQHIECGYKKRRSSSNEQMSQVIGWCCGEILDDEADLGGRGGRGEDGVDK
mmetsp:Transcript_29433/g.66648  ORF Transcript_29433/g.66648 Transcript_29433/m.66648 type:complete len:90 (+) Transcript_29433:855-1124(+)